MYDGGAVVGRVLSDAEQRAEITAVLGDDLGSQGPDDGRLRRLAVLVERVGSASDSFITEATSRDYPKPGYCALVPSSSQPRSRPSRDRRQPLSCRRPRVDRRTPRYGDQDRRLNSDQPRPAEGRRTGHPASARVSPLVPHPRIRYPGLPKSRRPSRSAGSIAVAIRDRLARPGLRLLALDGGVSCDDVRSHVFHDESKEEQPWRRASMRSVS